MKTEDSKWLEDLSRWMDGELDTHDADAFESTIDSDDVRSDTRAAWLEIRSELRAGAGDPMDSASVASEWSALESILPSRHREAGKPADENNKVIRLPWLWVGGLAAMAAAVALSLGVWIQDAGTEQVGGEVLAGYESDASISFVETDIPGASSMMYVDESSGWTIVWVTDPDPQSLSSSAS